MEKNMKFKINNIHYCKNNSECDRNNRREGISLNCRDICEDRFSSFEKNYSETIDLTFPNQELNKDQTDILCDEYWYDKELKINIMPLKRFIENEKIVKKFTFLYLIIKYLKNSDFIEKDIRDYIIKELDKYDAEITIETISYEDIVDILLDFNDYIPDEILGEILINAISTNFINIIQTDNIKLNIVDVDTIKNIILKKKKFAYKDIFHGNFNLEYDDWHPCSGCEFLKSSSGKNKCSLGNFCDDYDEENPCQDRS
jgi:hypothetical protein